MPAAIVISIDMPPKAHPALTWDRVTPEWLLLWGSRSPWDAFGALRCYDGSALPKPDVVTLLRSERGILMTAPLPGIHHVTAIASDPQGNVDFYTGVLGLRLVKLTVNFDDPGAYHLYYGDTVGHPGTLLTFFAWPGAPQGRHGTGQVASTAFSIPPGALDYWVERLNGCGPRSQHARLARLLLADLRRLRCVGYRDVSRAERH
jgi:catechol 2,3-dioxygenase-like lactoylglutathione lyase family enzyme